MTQDPTTVAEDLNDLIGFVDASPTPYHAVATAAALLDHAGFTALDPIEDWGPEAAGPAYVVRDGALVAWCPGRRSDPAAPLRMIGAHTDSPVCGSAPDPTVRPPGGASSASSSTAERCATRGWTGTWAWRAGSPCAATTPSSCAGSAPLVRS